MRFGFHVSIAGGFGEVISRAQSLECETIQIFTASQLRWKRPPIDEEEATRFKESIDIAGLRPLVVHLFYLPNFATPDEKLLERSRRALVTELNRAAVLGADFLVLHPGAYKESSPKQGIKRVSASLDYAMGKSATNNVKILVENTAGGGTRLGGGFDELADILDGIRQAYRVGICLDIAHLFQSGYPVHTADGLKETVNEFDRMIGLDRLYLLHLNDSKTAYGSRNDRHWHIGKGKIGLDAFRRIINHPVLKHLPAIMETPTSEDGDKHNMKTVKMLRLELG